MFFTASLVSDVLLAGIFLLILMQVRHFRQKRRWFIFDPLCFFWVGVLVIYFIEAVTGYDVYVHWYGDYVITQTLFAIFFGFAFVHLGYNLRLGTRLAERLPSLPDRLSRNGLLFASLVLILAGLIGWKLQIDSGGGLMQWASVPRGGADWEKISGYDTQLASLLTVGVGILLVHVEMHRRNALIRVIAWVLLGVMLLFFLYLGTRSRTILVVLMALMAWSLPRRRNISAVLLVPIFIALFVVTSFQAEYRGHFRNFSFNLHEIDWTQVPDVILPGFSANGDDSSTASRGSEFSITAAVVSLVPNQVPYALGVEFLQIFTHPIPRAFWPEKRYPKNEAWTPIHLAAGTSGHWVDYVAVPFVGGPAPGHVASWYYNGGYIGLVIGGLLVGVSLRFARGIYDRSSSSESYLLTSFVVLPLGFGSAISHPFDWIYTLPLTLTPLVVLIYLSRSPGRKTVRYQRTKTDVHWKSTNQVDRS